jgi:Peptidase A4 family
MTDPKKEETMSATPKSPMAPGIPLTLRGAYASPNGPDDIELKPRAKRNWIIPKLSVQVSKTHLLRGGRKRLNALNALNTNWAGGIVLNTQRVPNPAAGKRLDGYATPFNNQEHVNMIGADGHVYELYFAGSGWIFNDLTALTGAPLAGAASSLDGYATTFNRQQHINYIGADNHVHELWYDSAWHHNDLTAAAGAPNAAPGTALSGYESAFNNQQHVNYIGIDNHIHELWYDSAWHHNDLTGVAHAPNAATVAALDGYVTTFNNQQHVNYLAGNNHVMELWFDSTWHVNDLTAAAGAANFPAAGGASIDGYQTSFNNQQHVNYIGLDGHVHELWFDSAWHHNDLTAAAGAPPALAGSAIDGYATGFNRQQHVNYTAVDNHVHELWFDSAWHHNDLTQQAALVAATPNTLAGSALAGYSTEFNNQQHVIYIGTDNDVHELFFGGQWQPNDLTQSALPQKAIQPWTTATGAWKIPTVTEPNLPAGKDGSWNSSSWVGIDGLNTNDVLQAGIEQHVDGSGNASYVAWYEWFAPKQDNSPSYINQTNIDNFPVKPGDEVFCLVRYVSNLTQGSILFENETTGQSFSITLDPPPNAAFIGNSIEWIMEAPDGGEPSTSVPQFTPVVFTTALGSDINNNTGNPQNGITATIFRDGAALTATTLANFQVSIVYLPWHTTDLTQLTSAPAPVAGSSLDAYPTAFNRQQHINYIAADNHVHELFFDSAWHHNDLCVLAGAPNARAGSALDGYSTEYNRQQHVNYISADGNVCELFFSDRWRFNVLTQLAGAPLALAGGPIDGYATNFNNQQHVNYIGSDNHVHELFFDGAWRHNDLTALTGAPTPAIGRFRLGSALAGYATGFNRQQHVIFIGDDLHVHELFFDSAWHHNDLTALTGAPEVGVVTALDGYSTEYNQQQHINFLGADNNIHELFFDSAWHHNDLTQAAGAGSFPAVPASRLDGYSTEYNRQQHVNYVGSDNHLHELFFDSAWHHHDLNQQSVAPNPQAGTPLTGYGANFNNQEHVIFIGAEGDIHELWF